MNENEVLVYDIYVAINFISERCDIDKETILTVLELDEEYMRSVGIIN